MNESIRKFAYLISQEHKIEETRKALISLSQATRQEPACQLFDFFQDKENGHQFILHEHFSHQQGYDSHLEANYTQAFFEKGLVVVDRIVSVVALDSGNK